MIALRKLARRAALKDSCGGLFVLKWLFPKWKQLGDGMDKYNAEHYVDYTAAIAVSRADRGKTVAFIVRGGSYRIGDVYRFEWRNGVIEVWRTKAGGH